MKKLILTVALVLSAGNTIEAASPAANLPKNIPDIGFRVDPNAKIGVYDKPKYDTHQVKPPTPVIVYTGPLVDYRK